MIITKEYEEEGGKEGGIMGVHDRGEINGTHDKNTKILHLTNFLSSHHKKLFCKYFRSSFLLSGQISPVFILYLLIVSL